MISRRRVPGLLALALCVIGASAVMASSAFAAGPAFKPGGGKFPVYFTSTSGPATLATANHNPITCTSDTNVGEITSSTGAGFIIVTFHGCTQKSGTNTLKCKTTGAAEEEIVTNKLKGTLTGTEAAPTEKLEPESGTEFVKFKCGTVGVIVTGSVTGTVSPVKTQSHTGTLTFKEATGLTAFEEAAKFTNTDELAFFKNAAHTESETVEVT